MPFGLRNVAQTFQRFINEVIHGLDHSYAYIDDILIASKNEKEHLQHLQETFERLKIWGEIKPKQMRIRCQASQVPRIPSGGRGYPASTRKSRCNSEHKRTGKHQTIKTILLETLNFYRRFVSNAAEVQALLHEKGSKAKGRTPLHWTTAQEESFQLCKNSLARAALLVHPKAGARITLTTDASDTALGAVVH